MNPISPVMYSNYPDYVSYLPFWLADAIEEEYIGKRNAAMYFLEREYDKRNEERSIETEMLIWENTCVECGSDVYGMHFKECEIEE